MPRFNAFISYSQRSDKRIAEAIQTGLQALGAKRYLLKFRALQIFRDETSTTGNISLKEKIEHGLDDSDFLIIIASPAITKPSTNAQINWIEEEITYWLSTKHKAEFENNQKIKQSKIIICQADGEILWDHKKGDFDWEKTDCLPSVFKNQFAGEPHYISFKKIVQEQKKISDINQLTLSFPDFKKAIAQLSSIIQGKSPDELIATDRKAQSMWTSLLVSISLVLACLAVSLWFMTKKSNQYAEDSQRFAKESKKNEQAANKYADVVEKQSDSIKLSNDNITNLNIKLKNKIDSLEISEKNLKSANYSISKANTKLDISYKSLKIKSDSIKQESRERERKEFSVGLINNILNAENLALNSMREKSRSEKANGSVRAYKSLQESTRRSLQEYLGSDKYYYEKSPTVYDALRDAYTSSYPAIRNSAGLKAIGVLPKYVITASIDGKILLNKSDGRADTLRYQDLLPNTFILKIFSTHDPALLLFAMSNDQTEVGKIDFVHKTIKRVGYISTKPGLIKATDTNASHTLIVSETGGIYLLSDALNGPFEFQRIAHEGTVKLGRILTSNTLLTYDGIGQFKKIDTDGKLLDSFKTVANIKSIVYENVSDSIFYYDGQSIYKTSISGGKGKKVWESNIPLAKELVLCNDESKLIVSTDKDLYILDLLDSKEKRKHYRFASDIRQVKLGGEDVLFVGLESGEVKYWPIHFDQLYRGVEVLSEGKESITLTNKY